MIRQSSLILVTGVLAAGVGSQVIAQSDADLAQQLSNPISSLISVPFQFNWDDGYGPADGSRTVVNIQPVVPISLSPNWNLISRTIVPVISQEAFVPGGESVSGFGDTVQSFFFSPAKPTANGITWGAGPVLLIPTSSDDALGAGQWGAGPTGVVLRQSGPWTVGALGNHIWSFGGGESDLDISSTFLQPFLSYTTASATTLGLSAETTYDWESEQWSVPINASVGQLVKLGDQPVSLTAGVRYWAESPENGPEGWGLRFAITFLYPR